MEKGLVTQMLTHSSSPYLFPISSERDPRWGRACEVASEDPLINGDFGSQYTQGLQMTSLDDKILAGISTLKHWDAYSLEDSDGARRYDFNAIVSPYALATTYFPAFTKSVQEGGALGVMCASAPPRAPLRCVARPATNPICFQSLHSPRCRLVQRAEWNPHMRLPLSHARAA